MVADGTTVILGGLRKEQKKFSDKQMPYLGHVPLIGSLLFKRADTDNELTELVVFITPHIVQGDELVTGDEGGAIKEFRDYAPLLDPSTQAPDPAGASPPGAAPSPSMGSGSLEGSRAGSRDGRGGSKHGDEASGSSGRGS